MVQFRFRSMNVQFLSWRAGQGLLSLQGNETATHDLTEVCRACQWESLSPTQTLTLVRSVFAPTKTNLRYSDSGRWVVTAVLLLRSSVMSHILAQDCLTSHESHRGEKHSRSMLLKRVYYTHLGVPTLLKGVSLRWWQSFMGRNNTNFAYCDDSRCTNCTRFLRKVQIVYHFERKLTSIR